MKLVEGGRLQRPNMCWICERTPAEGTRVVDTERYFDGWPYSFQGRRYVCEKCVTEMVKFFDFVTANDVEVERVARVHAEDLVKEYKQKLRDLVVYVED